MNRTDWPQHNDNRKNVVISTCRVQTHTRGTNPALLICSTERLWHLIECYCLLLTQYWWCCDWKVLEATKALIRGHRRRRLELVNVAECQLLSERWASADCQVAMRQYLESVNDSLWAPLSFTALLLDDWTWFQLLTVGGCVVMQWAISALISQLPSIATLSLWYLLPILLRVCEWSPILCHVAST